MKNIVFCSIIFIVTICSMWYGEFKDVSQSVVRLHIVANSDLPEDQELKLAVRDYVIEKYKFNNKEMSLNYETIENNIDNITKDINKFLINNGAEYTAKSDFGLFYFPTKYYKNISLPCGNYNALKIVLGDGKGENWWCVMYPPLCFINNSYGELTNEYENLLKNKITDSQYKMITKPDNKFKTVEIINEFIHNIKD